MRILILVLLALSLSQLVHAKTNKFKRPSAAPSSDKGEASKDGDKAASPSGSGAPQAAGDGKAEGEKKVDLSDLENRYWAAKDTEFTVVQNRLYTKEKRFSLTAIGGPILSDSYSTAYNYGLAADYYFSERQGIEGQFWISSARDSDLTTAFKQRNGVSPDYNKPTYYTGLNYVWVPVYAKLSLLEKKILYFDIYFAPGIGVTGMEAETFSQPPNPKPDAPKQNALTVALDVGQQVFLDQHWALRIDARNHLYQEKVYSPVTGSETRTKTTYYGSIMVGVTFFFR